MRLLCEVSTGAHRLHTRHGIIRIGDGAGPNNILDAQFGVMIKWERKYTHKIAAQDLL